MNNNGNRNEKKNTVVEAILRARERELQQLGPEEDGQPGLTPEEHEAVYRRIMERLKAEGLMKDGMEKGEGGTSGTSAFTSAVEKAEDQGEWKDTAGKTVRKISRRDLADGSGADSVDRRNKTTRIHRFRRRAARAACVCLVAGAAVFALSMTGEANRLLLMQTVNTVLGTGDLMNVNNDDDRALSAGSEDEARQEIETALQAEVPDFYYLPEGMTFQGYQLFKELGYGILEYNCDEGYLYLQISNSISDMSQGNFKESDGNKAEEIETLSGKITVAIKKMEENKNQYEAVWKYRNVEYTLGGEVSVEELKKILKEISYDM